MSGKFREKERKAQVPVQAARETLPLDRYYPSYGQALAELDAASAAAGADAQQRQMAQDAAAIDQATKAAAQAALDAAVKAAEQKAAEQLRAAHRLVGRTESGLRPAQPEVARRYGPGAESRR